MSLGASRFETPNFLILFEDLDTNSVHVFLSKSKYPPKHFCVTSISLSSDWHDSKLVKVLSCLTNNECMAWFPGQGFFGSKLELWTGWQINKLWSSIRKTDQHLKSCCVASLHFFLTCRYGHKQSTLFEWVFKNYLLQLK